MNETHTFRPLYNEFLAENEDGRRLSGETWRAVEPIFLKFERDGFSPREIGDIMTRLVNALSAERTIFYAVNKRQANKKEGV